jgi:hypothetical protein
MAADEERTERLFSYGTLQLESIQLSTFGRLLTGTSDVLPGFERALLEIGDPAIMSALGQTHYAIARRTGRSSDRLTGKVFDLTPAELHGADAYETEAYTRVAVVLQSGLHAWAYVDARDE